MIKDLKDEVFDFVLHDSSHICEEVEKNIENILPKMKKNTILLVLEIVPRPNQEDIIYGRQINLPKNIAKGN